ncbi:MAG TPA: response regulator transcription factor [Flavobacteriales bacterium]|nr:response regulator transcription factor [Flavobacteriales bacterium]
MERIRIGIVDDHPALGQGLSCELGKNPGYEVLFVVTEKDKIKDEVRQSGPDVLIMDIIMPGSIGIEAFKDTLKDFPDLRILAYTSLNSPVVVEMLLKTGVRGYVSKNDTFERLKEAINEVYFDNVYLPEEYSFVRKKLKNNGESVELSKREIEVLTLIAHEKKTSEIADILCISVNTVETHRKNLFNKLNVTNLAGLIKAALNLGYIK